MKRSGHTAAVTVAALLLAVALCGCNTSRIVATRPAPGTVSPHGNQVVAQLAGTNTGVFLFYFIPLWSGTAHRPNQYDYTLFSNQVRPKYMHMMFGYWAGNREIDGIEDVKTKESASGLWSLGIFWLRRINGTALAVNYTKKKTQENK